MTETFPELMKDRNLQIGAHCKLSRASNQPTGQPEPPRYFTVKLPTSRTENLEGNWDKGHA